MATKQLASVGIRRATERDFLLLSEMAVISEVYRGFPILGWMRGTSSFTDLAEHDQPFGFVLGEWTPGDKSVVAEGSADGMAEGPGGQAGIGDIQALYIAPQQRRCGMGMKLMVRGMSVLKRRGCGAVRVWHNNPDSGAKGLLNRLEFRLDNGQRLLNLRNGQTVSQQSYIRSLESFF